MTKKRGELFDVLLSIEPNLPSWKKVNTCYYNRDIAYREIEFESIDNHKDSLLVRLFLLECGNYSASAQIIIAPIGETDDGLMSHDYQFESATCSEPPMYQIFCFVNSIMAFAPQFREKVRFQVD